MLNIVQQQKSDYAVVLCRDPSPSQRFAAEELSDFIEKLTGARLPVLDYTETPPEKAVCIGYNLESSDFGEEDFALRTRESRLYIDGGPLRGCLYGVYTLLEDYFCIRFFTPDCTKIPLRATLTLPEVDRYYKPTFAFRDSWMGDLAADKLWCVRRRINSPGVGGDPRLGGSWQVFGMGHNFHYYINPGEYYDEHPEYFSEVNGIRLREYTQLCLSNPDVFRIVLEKMRRDMREHPDKRVFAFAQEDWQNPCQCPACRAVDEAAGSYAGSLIAFCNQLCEELEEEFPENLIHTFAYQYTRKAPKNMRVHKNVLLQLCSIECCFERPLTECGEDDRKCNHEFVADLKAWSAIHDNITIFDYPCTWHHYLTINNNLYVQQPNIRLYADNNVTGMLELTITRDHNYGELLELKCYIIARLLFDKDFDVATGILEFTEEFYGEAGRIIRQYMEYVNGVILQSGVHQAGSHSPDSQVFTPEVMDRLNAIFDEAEAVCYDAVTLERVRKSRLPVDYYSAFFYMTDVHRHYEERFAAACEKYGIARLEERSTTAEQIFRLRQKQYFDIFRGLRGIVVTEGEQCDVV